MTTMNRRKVCLLVLGACASALGPVACGGAGEDEGDALPEARVPLSSIPEGGAYTPTAAGCRGRAGSFIVARDDEGVYAYTNTCAHAGGTVPVPDDTGLSKCCLHGSLYDTNGDLVEGVVPGQKSLRHLVVRLEGAGEDAIVVVSLREEEPDRRRRVPVAA